MTGRRVSTWTVLAWGVALAGLAFRLRDFGRYGFWNDEAWVALATRVEGWSQFWLALGVTPIGFAGALRGLAVLPGAPEVMLRLLPLGLGLATLWLAWRVGRALAGHPVGGVVALVVVALDPLGIVWAKALKPYTAEACAALLALDRALVAREHDGWGPLAVLAVALVGGALVATAALLVAPPVLGALALDAALRRDRRRLGRVLATGAGVALADALVYRVLVAPRLSGALDAYWAGHLLVAPTPLAAVGTMAAHLGRQLAAAWGPVGGALGLGALAVGAATNARVRLAAIVAGLLVVELGVVAFRRPMPLDAPRLLLFALTTLGVGAGGALGAAARGLAARRLVPLAALGLAVVAGDLVRHRDWARLGEPENVEDLGRLVRLVERERQPADGVVLYERSLYVWAYYATPTPRLLPNPDNAVGYHPWITDPNVVVGGRGDAAAVVPRAAAGRARVWLVGSRFRGGDERQLLAALARAGTVTLELRGARALVARAERAPALD